MTDYSVNSFGVEAEDEVAGTLGFSESPFSSRTYACARSLRSPEEAK
jgi:hypothetical protein